ncbi:MAG: hydrolase [Clostridiales Family XIII bacterium]|jgi:nicotinamidase-related amidase|nr:hydrolase [Clostridiales Family XIII bacterium]
MAIKRLRREESIFVCIDMQARLTPAMAEEAAVISSAKILLKAADIFKIPALITQQYTKGLGDTLEEIKEAKENFTYIEKSAFSAMGEPNFVKSLTESKKKSVIIFGIEAHVCVLQTALGLLEEGYDVFLVVDGISSRKPFDKKFGTKRMAQAGVYLTTVEAALFELLENDSKSETFKAISKLIK